MRGAQQREFERRPGTHARELAVPWRGRPSAFEAAAQPREATRFPGAPRREWSLFRHQSWADARRVEESGASVEHETALPLASLEQKALVLRLQRLRDVRWHRLPLAFATGLGLDTPLAILRTTQRERSARRIVAVGHASLNHHRHGNQIGVPVVPGIVRCRRKVDSMTENAQRLAIAALVLAASSKPKQQESHSNSYRDRHTASLHRERA